MSYYDRTTEEVKAIVKQIIRDAKSDDEIRQQIDEQLDYPYDLANIAIHSIANGPHRMSMLMMWGPDFHVLGV